MNELSQNQPGVYRLPTLAEIYSEKLPETKGMAEFNALLNKDPNPKWTKMHPYIKDWKYIPIDKIEFMLKMLFPFHKIEITKTGTAFNAVWVSVRIHYFHPILNEWAFHDGIGAQQLQTKKDTSPADLVNINNGAVSMALPIAEINAIKDAADKFGRLFGSDLNRKDVVPFSADNSVMSAKIPDRKLATLKKLLNDCKTIEDVENIQAMNPDFDIQLFNDRKAQITFENGN